MRICLLKETYREQLVIEDNFQESNEDLDHNFDFVFYQCNQGKLNLLLTRNPFKDEEVDDE